jgi:hypothetical protein
VTEATENAASDEPKHSKASARSETPDNSPDTSAEKSPEQARRKKRRSRWRFVLPALGVLVVLLIAARVAAPSFVRWYVNRTIDQSPLYDGKIGDVNIHLWRGAYSIEDVRLNKVTGNVPVPLFAAKRIDLAIEWNALLHGGSRCSSRS